MIPLVVLENGRNHPIQQIKNALQNAGMRVMTSFDSRRTRMDKATIPCSHHGRAECNCHIVVMLVYGMEELPATLLAYGQDNEISVSLTYPPGLRPSPILVSQIQTILKPSLLQA